MERLQKASHIQQLLFRMAVCDLLRIAKQHATYRELSEMLDLQITVISRYVKGYVMASVERGVRIWKVLGPIYGLKGLLMGLDVKPDCAVDTSKLLGDPSVLRLAAIDCAYRYAGYRVTKILTTVASAPLAAVTSTILLVFVVVAKNYKDAGVGEFSEAVRGIAGEKLDTLYIPKDSIAKRDSVLIVEDIVRTGKTVNALVELVERAKAEVTGVYCLLGFKQGLEKLRERGLKVEAVVEVV